METRADDVVQHMMLVDTHDILLFFTNKGRVTSIKCHRVPPAQSRTAKGMHINNLINMEPGEVITTPIRVKDFDTEHFILMASKRSIKRTALQKFVNIRTNGLIAFKLKPGDEVVSVVLVTETDDYIIVTRNGKALRTNVSNIPNWSRVSGGVKSITLQGSDQIISMDLVRPNHHLMVVSERGFGKLTQLRHYISKKGKDGRGVDTFKVNEKTGHLVAAKVVNQSQELMLISKQGTVIRTSVVEISEQGRSTQGVHVMKPDTGDSVAALACSEGQTELVNGAGSNGHIPSK